MPIWWALSVHSCDLYASIDEAEITGLHFIPEPRGVVIISAVDAYEDQLRLLDDALRQDVPGAAGWKWDPGDFHEETFDQQFDPATYLIAVDSGSGDYMGLVRVWDSPGRPRLGLMALLREYRRRGLASALLARAFRVLHERGRTDVTAEVDDTNMASRSLMVRLAPDAMVARSRSLRGTGNAPRACRGSLRLVTAAPVILPIPKSARPRFKSRRDRRLPPCRWIEGWQ